VRWFLFKVFGRGALLGYGCVSLLSVAVLAALYMTSRYALHDYVADQLTRIPWDISVVQRGQTHRFAELQALYRKIPAVRDVEAIGFLRIKNMDPVWLQVDGQLLSVRWVGFVAAGRTSLLPPDLRPPETPVVMPASAQRPLDITVALVGLHGAGRDAEAGQAAARLRPGAEVQLFLGSNPPADEQETGDHQHGGPATPGDVTHTLFAARLSTAPAQIERQAFNRWMLREVGSLSYLPGEALIVAVPMELFVTLAQRFHTLLLTTEGAHGGEAPPPYVPEVTHLIALDQSQWVSAWDLPGSLARMRPLVRDVFEHAQWLTPFSYVTSDLFVVLQRMNRVAQLVGLVSLLVAIPLLWMVWVLGRTLSGLIVLNQRRLIGLALIRGVPINEITRTVLLALVLGGVIGGLLGLGIGVGLPVAGYVLTGGPPPPSLVLMRAVVYFGFCLLLGVVLALLSGRAVLNYIRRLSPREALARVQAVGGEAEVARLTRWSAAAVLVALGLGGYKILSWMAGRSLALPLLRRFVGPDTLSAFVAAESLLNFIAVPLFLFGLAGLFAWRVTLVQKMLSGLTAPLVGSLHWFVGQHMALRRRRIVNLLFVAALSMSLSLLPQVASDSFFDRVLRGVAMSLGGHLLLDFNVADLTPNPSEAIPVVAQHRLLSERLAGVRRVIGDHPEVASLALIEQFIVPGFYLPSQSGLALNVIEDPDAYLNSIRYEDGLGRTRSFPNILAALADGRVSASQGLLRVRSIALGREIQLGYDRSERPVPTRVDEVLSFLPGQPSAGVQQREGYATAEIEYLNYILGADARIVAAASPLEHSALGSLLVLPARAVFLVRTKSGQADEALATSLVAQLPVKPEEVRWDALEQQRVSKDMFIALALENMSVYVIGGLLLALAAVAAIGVVNYLADHRTLALLRLRGVPLPVLLRISLSIFLIPVLLGVATGLALGAVAGYGVSQAIWELPRVYGVAGFLSNRLVFSQTAWAIVALFSVVLTAIAIGFGLWQFRRTAREALREG
jgi:hypothetical protein